MTETVERCVSATMRGVVNVYIDTSSGKRFLGRPWRDEASAEEVRLRQIDVPANHFVSPTHLKWVSVTTIEWVETK